MIRCPNCGEIMDPSSLQSWGGWTLNTITRELSHNDRLICRFAGSGQPIIMERLLYAKGQLVRHKDLYGAIYSNKPECDWPDSKIIAVHIARIRALLRGAGYPYAIRTTWGAGLQLIPEDRSQ